MSEEIIVKKNPAPPQIQRRPKKIFIPRRVPSVVVPPREVIYPSPDKNTCSECTCFPKEAPYKKPQKLIPCLKSPLTLYELAAVVVDKLIFPEAFQWSEEDVAIWMGEELGLPQYKECILKNHINGMRLLMLEDSSKLPEINIHDFKHTQLISKEIQKLFGTDVIKFARSIGLPPRKLLTHCTWFKSRTGPTWGIRQNWSRCDILRWMKIIMPAPIYRDHWDLVWYKKPDFPKIKFARIERPPSQTNIPHYKPDYTDVCYEYLVPRKFRFQTGIAEEAQLIWMEYDPPRKDKQKAKLPKPKESRLVLEKINMTGLAGRDLILARRKMPRPKFLS